jgi:hypothetical protein
LAAYGQTSLAGCLDKAETGGRPPFHENRGQTPVSLRNPEKELEIKGLAFSGLRG